MTETLLCLVEDRLLRREGSKMAVNMVTYRCVATRQRAVLTLP